MTLQRFDAQIRYKFASPSSLLFMKPGGMNLPDFLIVGAQKAGTTSLYYYLRSHPEIYMSPIKEPKYFAWPDRLRQVDNASGPRLDRKIIWTLESYQALFSGRSYEKAAGEASPIYLWSAHSSQAIRNVIPDARLIAILRNPADRAYSHFRQNRKISLEKLRDFRPALEAEEERIRRKWPHQFFYKRRGLYASQLERYYSLFPREQLLILLYDDFIANPAGVLKKICHFIGVDDQFEFDTRDWHNATQDIPKNTLINRLLTTRGFAKSILRPKLFDKMYAMNLAPIPPFSAEARQELLDFFEADILSLQKMIDRDLSMWLKN